MEEGVRENQIGIRGRDQRANDGNPEWDTGSEYGQKWTLMREE